jgi:hypothetical protein
VLAPLAALAIVIVVNLSVPVAVRLVGGTWTESLAGALLTPLFVPVFGIGVIRGLYLAFARAIRVSARPA